MGQVGSDEDHIPFFEGVDPIADDPAAVSFLYQYQLELGVEVEGGVKSLFVPVDYGQPAIVKKGDLGPGNSHMAILVKLKKKKVIPKHEEWVIVRKFMESSTYE